MRNIFSKTLSLTAAIIMLLSVLNGCGKKNEDVQNKEFEEFSIELETDPVTEAVTEKKDPVVTKASFIGCGDNIIYFGNVRDAKSLAYNGGREYNFKPAYSDVADYIAAADIAYINQETVMAGDGFDISYYPCFNSPQDLAYDLSELGFDVVNVATNHMLDKGGSGLNATIEYWKTFENITMIGGYLNDEDFFDVPIVETNGIKIAYIAYTEMTNGISLGSSYDTHIPYLDKDNIKKQTDSVKDKCDFIVASVHWGVENDFEPSETQLEYAKWFADCGVDVIIGTHPHVLQPIEWIEGKDGHRTLCCYSLGNFMAEMDYAKHMAGGFISFDIVKTDDEHAVVENAHFEPTVFYFPSNFYNNHIYFMKDFTDELAAKHGVNTFYGNTLTFDMLKGYVTDNIDSEFLPDYLK